MSYVARNYTSALRIFFCYALNIRLLLRAINEYRTQTKGSTTGLPVWYLVISVIFQLTERFLDVHVSGMSFDITSGKKKSRNYK